MSAGSTGIREVELLLDPDSPLRRYYEDLAVNLVSIPHVRSIVVTSPEAGAGCTSVSLGLGAALAGMERQVAVVDCNLRDPNLHRMLGEPNFVGLTSALSGGRERANNLEDYGHEISPGLLALPTGPVSPSSTTVVRNSLFVERIRSLEARRDFVILDSPVVSEIVASSGFSRGFDGALLVVHASRTSKQAAREATEDLLDADVNLLGVVLNGCP